MSIILPALAHVGVVVTDMERAAADYQRRWGVATEPVFELDLSQARLHGRDVRMIARYGFISSGASQIELIQPLSKPSPYTEFLEANGRDGVHHLAYYVDSIDSDLGQLGEAGELTQVTLDATVKSEGAGQTRFVYLDGLMHGPAIELIQAAA